MVTRTTGKGINTTEAIIVILLLMQSPTTITIPLLPLFLHVLKMQPLFTERLKVVPLILYYTRKNTLDYFKFRCECAFCAVAGHDGAF